jgi:hypothetical protein
MVTASPPVSPSVVARILMIQNTNVTCGTLATSSDVSSFILFKIAELSENRLSAVEVLQLLTRRQNGCLFGQQKQTDDGERNANDPLPRECPNAQLL